MPLIGDAVVDLVNAVLVVVVVVGVEGVWGMEKAMTPAVLALARSTDVTIVDIILTKDPL